MSTNKPLVSVIIPTFNRAALIAESIQSVLKQSFTNFELLIVDDGSTDGTADLIQQIPDQRLRYLALPHTGLLGKVRNEGIKNTTGEYIAFLDSDDLWRSDKLSFQIELFHNYKIDYCLSNGNHFGEYVAKQPPDVAKFLCGNLFDEIVIRHKLMVYMPSLIFRRSVFDAIGPLDEKLKSGADIDFVFRMASKLPGAFTNERLVSIRKHGQGMSSKLATVIYREDQQVLKNLFDNRAISRREFRKLHCVYEYKLGLFELRSGNATIARRHFYTYVVSNPLDYKGWVRLLQSVFQSVINR